MVSGGLPKATLRERLEARSESPRRATRRNDRGHEQAIECSRSRDTGGASRASGEGDPEGAFPGRAARARQKRRTAVPEQKPSGRRAPCGPGAPRRKARHPVGGAAGPTPRDSSESAPISLTGTEPPSWTGTVLWTLCLATVFSTPWLPDSDNLAKEPPMPQISAFPSIKALSILLLVPLNSTSLPWWTTLSIIAEASLSSPRIVPHLPNSMLVVNTTLRFS